MKRHAMNMKRLLVFCSVSLTVIAIFSGAVYASQLSGLTSFSSGQVISSSDMNANFTAVENAHNDSDTRLTAVETVSYKTRIISANADALSYNPAGATITKDSSGLKWQSTFSGGALLRVRQPADYAGGDVTMRFFFQTTTATAGTAGFFIRPTSYNSGDTLIDPGSVSCSPVAVSGSSGFGIVYEEACTIPLARFQKNWWYITIQRFGNGSGETYPDDIILNAVDLEYAVQ